MTTAGLVARRLQIFGKGEPLFYEQPLHVGRGEGAYLFDADACQ